MTETVDSTTKPKDPGFNDRMKRDKLTRQIQRAHEWRVQVWAQSERRIQQANAALKAMGSDPVVPFEPDFNDPDQLEHYATMKLRK